MKTFLFDLDDTLYNELDFVNSAFEAVSDYLARRHSLKREDIFSRLGEILAKNGRGKVFDTLLKELGVYSRQTLKSMLYVYRCHAPVQLGLYPDVLPLFECLTAFDIRLGIVTDGIALVQHNKIRALGLDEMVQAIVYTDLLGECGRKPSSVPFEIAVEMLGGTVADAVYLGDDPSKDFIGPNLLGMCTVQVKREKQPGSIHVPAEGKGLAGARFIVNSLAEVLSIISVR